MEELNRVDAKSMNAKVRMDQLTRSIMYEVD